MAEGKDGQDGFVMSALPAGMKPAGTSGGM
jgi:hypothetical protein